MIMARLRVMVEFAGLNHRAPGHRIGYLAALAGGPSRKIDLLAEHGRSERGTFDPSFRFLFLRWKCGSSIILQV